jgi:hypothetical protein
MDQVMKLQFKQDDQAEFNYVIVDGTSERDANEEEVLQMQINEANVGLADSRCWSRPTQDCSNYWV